MLWALRVSNIRASIPAVILGSFAIAASLPARAGETTRANVSTAGAQAESGNSLAPDISADGRFVAFESNATGLVPGGYGTLVYLRDRLMLLTERISVSTSGEIPDLDALHGAVSDDGRFVAFYSGASNLVSPSTVWGRFNVYVRDRQAGTTVLVSQTAAGVRGNSHSRNPAISADGRFVVFETDATNLVDPATNGRRHIVRWDRLSGEIVLVSRHASGAQADAKCEHASVSDDGNVIAFHSLASLESRDQTGNQDIYVRDIAAEQTELVSVSWDGTAAGSLHSYEPAISGDGWRIAFHSVAGNLIHDNPVIDGPQVYVRDRHGAGSTYRASVNGAGQPANGDAWHASISADGNVVAFESSATNLVDGDTNGWWDIFVNRRVPATTQRVSVPDDALGDPEGNGWSWHPALGAGGRVIAFESWSTDLVADDTNGIGDIFVRDDPTLVAGLDVPPSLAAGLRIFPNPFNPRVDIEFGLPAGGPVRLSIFDISGREVRRLLANDQPSGVHRVTWDGRDGNGRSLPSGVYVAELTSGPFHTAQRLTLVK